MPTPDPSRAAVRRARVEVSLGALAFALSVPSGKTLLARVSPLALSGGLYLSAGVCLALLVARSRADARSLRGRDWWWLGGSVLSGGILAPLALLLGLRRIPAHVGGLLLNFEIVFTLALGALLHGERLGRRGWAGGLLLALGGVLLALPSDWMRALAASGATGVSACVAALPWGALVVGACALWALDNNLTQHVSLRDAREIVAIKGLVGGAASLGLAALFGEWGGWTAGSLAAAMKLGLAVAALGAVSYGISIVLYVRGLRELGVLQTSAFFALAPGFAAILSWALLHEAAPPASLGALAAMTAGALLVATDRHEHPHGHEAIEHAHEHVHDEHHQHEHTPEELASQPHSHAHTHATIQHSHPHVHDVHHRHRG